ncbi:peptidoglycan D,D-transpeptidase FtsI family protein [Ferdinandcohnia sp. Marseille-Q9671]
MIKKKKSHVPFRLNMLFFAVFLLFSALVLRLGVVQIVHGEKFQKEVEKTENEVVNLPVPRGKIYDAKGNVIVDNQALNAITYTRARGTKQEEVLVVAEELAKIIEMKTDKVTERDLKDFWMLKYPKEAEKLVTKKELKKMEDGDLSSTDIYKLQIDRITEKDLKVITEEELEVAAIFREMTKGYALVPQIVKNENVTPEEYAIVSENLENLPGVNTTTDWIRDYRYDHTLKSILGRISDTDEGLPGDKLDYYLSRGYNRNDRVGLSYLEAQYESVLHGQKAKVENVIKGNAVQETIVISEGQRGSDLVLTIDMELQQAVEQILEEQIKAHKQMGGTQYLDRAFVVMMNPKTGELLSMAGKVYARGEDGNMGFQDYALGTMNAAYEMGSAVKGATMLTGYDTGVLGIGSRYYDSPMKIGSQGSLKGSWKNLGDTNDLKALEMSSNVYMFKTFLDLAGGNYAYGQPISIDTDAFRVARNYFSQFGLGVKTGIDLPGEATGYPGTQLTPGLLMDLSIGQYDTYTTLQLAQYVSTIANGGYRMQPKIVRQIHQPTMEENELGPIQVPFEPTVMNKVDIDQKYFDRVQQGFRLVFQGSGGTARSVFSGKPYNAAGKTGSAQSFINGIEAVNSTLVGYAPFDNPEVAFAVVIPYAYYGNTSHNMNLKVGEAILDKYFELKEKRATEPHDEAVPTTEQNEETTEDEAEGQ